MTNTKINVIVKIGLLAAAAFILQLIGSMMGIKVAGFLEIEFSDIPAILGTFALGPFAGVAIEFIKNLLKCFATTTGFVGEFANFVINGSFVFVVGLIYKMNKTKKGAVISLILGTVVMTLFAVLANLYIMLPLYMPTAPFDVKLQLVLSTITPFNFVRGLVLSAVTMFLYKPLSPILHK